MDSVIKELTELVAYFQEERNKQKVKEVNMIIEKLLTLKSK